MAVASSRRRTPAWLTLIAALSFGGLGVETEPAFATDTACDVYAAPPSKGGDDSNRGTSVDAPVATIHRLLRIMPPGKSDNARGVACVRGGNYDFSTAVEETLNRPWTTLRPYHGQVATLRGRLVIGAGADHSIVEGLRLNGYRPNHPASPSLVIYGEAAVLRENEITNDHDSICVHVAPYFGVATNDVVISGNWIHDCGSSYYGYNHDNGIYVTNASGTRIVDNVVSGNQDRGIQLYEDVDSSVVEGNIVDNNGQGIAIAGDPAGTSDDNLIRYNLITRSNANYADPDGEGPKQGNDHGWNLEFVNNATGSGNVVSQNCFWATHPVAYRNTNGGINLEESGGVPVSASYTSNRFLTEDPYLDDTTYRIENPDCTKSALRAYSPPYRRLSFHFGEAVTSGILGLEPLVPAYFGTWDP